MPLEIRGAHFLIRSAQLVRGTPWREAASSTPSTTVAARRIGRKQSTAITTITSASVDCKHLLLSAVLRRRATAAC